MIGYGLIYGRDTDPVAQAKDRGCSLRAAAPYQACRACEHRDRPYTHLSMNGKAPFPLGALLTLWVLLCGATQCTEVTIDTEVDSQQRVSDDSGNFDGRLSSGDRFGSAIANLGDLEGDGVVDLAVGTPFDDDNGRDRGAVWILFLDDDGRVDQQQKISEEKGDFDGELDNDDRFGSAVAGIGDLNSDGALDMAVGAPLDDDGGNDRGAVWVLFLNNDDGRVRDVQKISDRAGGFDGDLNDGDGFGGAIARIGDLNGDGVPDLAVGAPQDNDGGLDKGAVWILFMNNDGTVRSAQKISEDEGDLGSDLDIADHFGGALAGIGDLDGDGTNDLAVGASQDDDGGLDRGAVWILFLNPDGTVDATRKISQDKGGFDGKLSDGDGFGSAVANIGDLDGDGVIDLAVGAPQDADGGRNRGAVWILFLKDNGKVESQVKISATEGGFRGSLSNDDRFGSAVSGLGDLDGNGANDIAAGTPLDDGPRTDQGAVWMLFMKRTKTETDFGLFPRLAPRQPSVPSARQTGPSTLRP